MDDRGLVVMMLDTELEETRCREIMQVRAGLAWWGRRRRGRREAVTDAVQVFWWWWLRS